MTFRAPRVATGRAAALAFRIPHLEGTVPRLTRLLVVVCLSPLCLAAQESDAGGSPFRGGQWAMQFGGSVNLFSLGVLRFTSPRGAWLLDLSTGAQFLDAEQTDGVTTTSADQQFIDVAARLGRRFYQTPGRRVVSFQTIALEGGLADQMFEGAFGSVRQTVTSYGLNGEIGGAYMLANAVSIGGTALVSVGRFKLNRKEVGTTTEGTGWYINGVAVVFSLAIYF